MKSPRLEALRAALEKAEFRLAATQDLARVGDWELDRHTGRMHWSRELFRLFERPEALGVPDLNEALGYFSLDSTNRTRDLFWEAIDTGRRCALEQEVLLPSGEERRHFTVIVPVTSIPFSGAGAAAKAATSGNTSASNRTVPPTTRSHRLRFNSTRMSVAPSRSAKFLATTVSLYFLVDRFRLEIRRHKGEIVLVGAHTGGIAKRPERQHFGPRPLVQHLVIGAHGVFDSLGGPYGARPARMVVPARLGDKDRLVAVAVGNHQIAHKLGSGKVDGVRRGRLVRWKLAAVGMLFRVSAIRRCAPCC